jgi:NAD-reducing hydrogenase small subunit
MSEKKTLATVWLDGCSGCHMSLLDMDERLIELSQQFDLVCSPLVDQKIFPPHVDITLIEGAIGNEEDLEKIHLIRERTRILVSLGDCAVTGNVSALRNPFGADAVLRRVYGEPAGTLAQVPKIGLPRLLNRVRPLHDYVHVDLFVPGCPPSADSIYMVLSELLAGRMPDLSGVARFG